MQGYPISFVENHILEDSEKRNNYLIEYSVGTGYRLPELKGSALQGSEVSGSSVRHYREGRGPHQGQILLSLGEVAPCLCQSRRARLAIDFSTGWACVSRASGVLGVCIMITLALLRTETTLERGIYHLSPGEGLSVGSWQAWHDSKL